MCVERGGYESRFEGEVSLLDEFVGCFAYCGFMVDDERKE